MRVMASRRRKRKHWQHRGGRGLVRTRRPQRSWVKRSFTRRQPDEGPDQPPRGGRTEGGKGLLMRAGGCGATIMGVTFLGVIVLFVAVVIYGIFFY